MCTVADDIGQTLFDGACDLLHWLKLGVNHAPVHRADRFDVSMGVVWIKFGRRQTPACRRARSTIRRKVGRPLATEEFERMLDKTAAIVGDEAAGILVEQANERTGKEAKFASAHDLRRSCAERMLDAGVPPGVISRILRHTSWETTRRHYAPGDVQKDDGILRDVLCREPSVPGYRQLVESP